MDLCTLSQENQVSGLGSSTFRSTWVKYKYFSNLQVQVHVLESQYMDGIKYVFNQVQVQVPSTFVTNNSTKFSPKLIYNHYPGTYSYI